MLPEIRQLNYRSDKIIPTALMVHNRNNNDRYSNNKQELGYRRQLRTQYVVGIYDNPITLLKRTI